MVNYIKVGVEGTFGTHATTAGIKVASISEDIDRSVMIEETIDNYIADAGYGGPLKISGSIEGNIKPKQFALFLQACLGDASSPYTLSVPKSLSIDVGEELAAGGTGQETQYVGCGISKLSLKFVAKEFATFTADWFAKNFSIAAFSAPTIDAEDSAVFYNASVTFAGVPSTEIKEITLDIDRKLDDDNFVLNDYTLHRLARTGITDISGSITFSEIAWTEYLTAITGSSTGTAIDANNTLGDVVMTIVCTDMAGVTSMTISCPVTLYGKGGRKIDKVSEVEKTVDFVVVGSGFSITVA